jgi:hypothetical protein
MSARALAELIQQYTERSKRSRKEFLNTVLLRVARYLLVKRIEERSSQIAMDGPIFKKSKTEKAAIGGGKGTTLAYRQIHPGSTSSILHLATCERRILR